MKNSNKKVLSLISAITTKAAEDLSNSTCVTALYQPKEPKSLQKK
ncbi:cyclic lactone autoinducer peptide [Clostridium cellulovorans]|uniref:Putative lipoprotein n=1 Tax=Clostridium cellulovorans (strain ATCC 35296 / DSM 3052 / OCM 3 / 743B) TaxID=573061 RepID=D9SUT4_CLOC7|nr:cyclic lactone autoinducer peptide [Clostridium cellulovorans]ADL50989.1 putative lipoprotein [Clostridium cellulovorans 743B]